MTGDRLSVIEKQLDDTETRESTVMNKQRHPTGPIVLLLLAAAGLVLAGWRQESNQSDWRGAACEGTSYAGSHDSAPGEQQTY